MFWIVLLSLLACCVAYYFLKKSKLSHVPGPKPIPLLGNALQIDPKFPHKTFMQWGKIYGPIVKLETLFGKQVILITDPEVFQKDILLKYKPKQLEVLNNLAKYGLVSLEGDEWKMHRKALRPMFINDFLKKTLPIMKLCLQSFFDTADQKLATADKFEVEMCEPLKHMTMDVLCISMLSFDGKARTGEDKQRVGFNIGEAFDLILQESMKSVIVPWLAFLPNRKLKNTSAMLKKFAIMVGDLHRNESKESGKLQRLVDKDLVDLLLEADPAIDDIHLADEIIVFLFAGHDTTANTMTFLLYEIARNPAVQQRIVDEIISVLGNDEPTFENLNKLPYLNATIKETLRLYPPAPGTSRKTDKADTVGGIALPANTDLVVSFYAIHRDPVYWGADADVFNPDRFLDNTTDRHPCCYAPFSLGSRNCIGQPLASLEALYFLAELLRNYEFTPSSKPLNVLMSMTLTAESGMHVNVSKRRQA